ncbi:hypothetical protein [Lacticaseibacillus camelliae]|uniref:Uncharacterized protein n=1 Tax=Lacticaseibacillus camelliae DSM 22697 = JCM 13995 TaxID=1423730 RepID=A0A0R2F7W4_9LACO|nr:hypothetical protein [Lacticaseibacillus camelliae]KRN22501.1 hypothetical protein FC75_GL001780 [Lacticaseibacillus camelliae DSM 22697 = JCM 13995]
MSVKKWNTIFTIAVPVGVALIFILTRILTGPHTRLLAWIGMFVWLIGSQVWQSRVTKRRYEAQSKLWALADERGLSTKTVRQLVPQYSEHDLDESRPENHRFLMNKAAIKTLAEKLPAQQAPVKKHHRK